MQLLPPFDANTYVPHPHICSLLGEAKWNPSQISIESALWKPTQFTSGWKINGKICKPVL